MANLTISYYLDKLVMDVSFIDQLETALENIIKNEKIDVSDIPEIIYTIFQTIQHSTTLIINSQHMSNTIEHFVLFLLRKYNVNITETELSIISNVVKSSITLLFTSPTLKKGCCC